MHVLLELFLSFFKIGMFAFGGGYAILPILRAELVKRKRWVTDEEIINFYSVSQCTPGIIAVNVSIFIGYKLKGLVGGITAALGIITSPIIIIISLANILELFMDNKYVEHAFSGIRIVVIALVLDVVIDMGRKGMPDILTKVIFAVMLILLLWLSISPVLVVVGAAVFGLIVKRGVHE